MSGYVYFFETGDGLMKIGKANNVDARFKQIQTSCPTGLTNIGSIQSDHPYVLEKEIHKKFKKYRKSGEWFEIPSYMKFDIVHRMRLEFDVVYANEYRKRVKEETFQKKGFIIYEGEDWEPVNCPECSYPNHHLEGVYFYSSSKYENVVILVRCEDCGNLHGNLEGHGKGGKDISKVSVRWIPSEWRKLI